MGTVQVSAKLREAIRCSNGNPILKAGLESSVEGLYILSAPEARGFGPFIQFVSVTKYTSQALAHEKVRVALTSVVDRRWRARSQVKVIVGEGGWKIVGPGKEEARLAEAVLDGGRLPYELSGVAQENVR